MLRIHDIMCQDVDGEWEKATIFFERDISLGTIYEEIEDEYGKYTDELHMSLTFMYESFYPSRSRLVC